MPCVLHDEEHGDLECHLAYRGKRDAVRQTEVDRNGVEEPDLGKLDGEMAEENQAGAFPLLLQGWDLLVLDLVLVEVRNTVNHHPEKRSAKVDDLVNGEAQDTRCQCIVLHPEVPGLYDVQLPEGRTGLELARRGTYRPESLSDIELRIVVGNLLEDVGEAIGLAKRPGEGGIPVKKESQYTRRKLRSGVTRREEAYMVAIVKRMVDFQQSGVSRRVYTSVDECP